MSKPLARRRLSKEQPQPEKQRLTPQCISPQNETIYSESNVSTAGNIKFYNVHSQMPKEGQPSFVGSTWDKVPQATTMPVIPPHQLQQEIWQGNNTFMPPQTGTSQTTGADPWLWEVGSSQVSQIAPQSHLQQQMQNYDIYAYHQHGSTEQTAIQTSTPNQWAPVEQAQPLQANLNQQQEWSYQPNYFTENNSNNNAYNWQNGQQHNMNEYHQWYGNTQPLVSQPPVSQPPVHNQKEDLALLNQHNYSSALDWNKHWTNNTGTDAVQQLFHSESVSSNSELKTLQSDPENIEANSIIMNNDVVNKPIESNSAHNVGNYTEISSGANNVKSCYSNTELSDSNGGLSVFFNNDSPFTDSLVPTQSSHISDKKESAFVDEHIQDNNCDINKDQQSEQDNENIHNTSNSSLNAHTDFNYASKGNNIQDDASNITAVQQEINNLTLNAVIKDTETFTVEEPINQEVPEPSADTSQLGPDVSERLGGVGDDPEQPVPTTTYQNTEEPVNQQVPDIAPVFTANQSIDNSRNNSSSVVQQERGVIIRPREGSPFKPPSKQAHLLGNIVQQELDNVTETSATTPDHSVQEVNLETPPENLEQPLDMEMLSQQSSWNASFHRHHSHQRCNNSPSTTLWDSPDLPSVTLVPAAPMLSSQSEKTVVPTETTQQSAVIVSNCNPSAVPRQSPLGWEGSQPEVMTQPLLTNSLAVPSENHGQTVSDTASLTGLEGAAIPPPPPPLAMELLQRTSPQGAGHIQQHNQPASDTLLSSSDISHLHHDNHPRNNSQAVGEARRTRYDDTALPPERHSRQETDTMSRQRIVSGHHGTTTEREESSQSRRDISQRRDFHPNYQLPANEQLNRWDRGYQGSRHGAEDDPRRAHHHVDDRSTRSETWDRRSDSRHYPEDKRYSSLDERDYFSERDRSRPSSRTSLSESIDGQERYYRDRDYRHVYYQDRGRTPTSESERGSWPNDRKYYRNSGYDSEMYDRYGHYRRSDDPYQQNSNGYRGYNYDMYRQDPRSYYRYYDMYRYGYNNYNYGYYDELYRTDQRYPTLDERYQEYYAAQAARDSDYERVSVHSGRSSVNDEQRESQNRYVRDADQSSLVGSEYSGYNQNLQQYESSYNCDFAESTRLGERESLPSSRLTPTKFSCPHPIVCFSPGGLLLTVFPSISTTSHSSLVQIHNVQELIGTEECIAELSHFPGPLLRGKTHKNDVIQFCQKKVRQLKEKEIPDRESCILLWELMIRLLRQNGCVDGSDVAELLLSNHEVLQPQSQRSADIAHEDGTLVDTGESARQISSGDTPSPDEGIVVTHDRTILNSTDLLTMDKVTRKFREFLFFGGKQDALEWAMKHNLWGHALFLASKMDSRTYANVMKRFANSLEPNDPLQTLYQLMSGRQPASVTRVADEKWGDWRPHLAMILSNPSARTEVDLRSITTLGDTLASLGCLAAAHFCYLMAQVEFGSFSNKSSKLVLLGSSNLLPFQSFASNEAIQCTEVYEYAQTLANPDYMIPHLQSYKFIYATRLLEYGFPQEALHYCEIISLSFHKLSGSVSPELVSQVFELANKLKYHDPHFTQGQGELEELGDPAWLLQLQSLRNYSGEFIHTSGWNNCGNLSTSNVNDTMDLAPQINAESPVAAETNVTAADLQGSNTQHFQGYTWSNQGSIMPPTDQVSSVQDVNLNQMTNGQYQFNYSNMQWNADTVQPECKTEQFNSVEGGAVEVSSSTNTASTTVDYYSASTQQVHTPSTLSTREHADSVNSGIRWDRRESTLSNSSSFQPSQKQPSPSMLQSQSLKSSVESSKKVEGKDDKAKTQVGRSWLGGIFSKFLPKAPNQMILPDDKNPAILWDSVKNRWINTDEDDDDESGKPAAPPKDSELMKLAGEEMSLKGLNSPAGQNRFQKPKVRGMRQNYVDVLNPGTTRPNTDLTSELMLPNNNTIRPNTDVTSEMMLPNKNTIRPELMLPNKNGNIVSPDIFFPQTAAYSEENVHDLTSQTQSPSILPPPLPPDNPHQIGKTSEGTNLSPLMFDPAEFASRSGSNIQRPGVGKLARRAFLT